MEFDTFRDQAANYLEDAGHAYQPSMDDRLWALYNQGVKPWDVPVHFVQQAA